MHFLSIRLFSTFPSGFRVAATKSGVKSPKNKNLYDLALISSTTPCTAAAVFTKNAFAAPPVLFSKELLQSGKDIHNVLVNSGCANAATAEKGWMNAREAAKQVGNGTLLMSTGVIGQQLQMDKIIPNIHNLKDSMHKDATLEQWDECALAFMTTDTFPKLLTRSLSQGAKAVGICKGAGMIHPNMATMLGIVCTDLAITKDAAQQILTYATDRSFNCISVDGDMSTNDTCILLANGAAIHKGRQQVPVDVESPGFHTIRDEITVLMSELAQLIVRDGEGATKFVKVTTEGAASYAFAKRVCEAVCCSLLVKTALYGEDANWGRILAAIGSLEYTADSTERIEPSEVGLLIRSSGGSIKLVRKGEPLPLDEELASKILKERDLEILIQLTNDATTSAQAEKATMWTCDLSHKYIDINADYRS